MGDLSRLLNSFGGTACRLALAYVLITAMLTSAAFAAPVTYTGVTITDGQLV